MTKIVLSKIKLLFVSYIRKSWDVELCEVQVEDLDDFVVGVDLDGVADLLVPNEPETNRVN